MTKSSYLISNEGEIRKNIIEADLIDCMVALPPQLFFNTGIPACLWFLTKDKKNNKFKDRRSKTLFIDARKMGTMIDRRHRILTEDDIRKISSTYHAWRGEGGEYNDIPGFCKSSDIEEIRKNNYVLTPGRYVGTEEEDVDDEKFEEKMQPYNQPDRLRLYSFEFHPHWMCWSSLIRWQGRNLQFPLVPDGG